MIDMSNNVTKQQENFKHQSDESNTKQNTRQTSFPYDQQVRLGQNQEDPKNLRHRPWRFSTNNHRPRQQRQWSGNTPYLGQNFGGNQMFRGSPNANGWYTPVYNQLQSTNRQQHQNQQQ